MTLNVTSPHPIHDEAVVVDVESFNILSWLVAVVSAVVLTLTVIHKHRRYQISVVHEKERNKENVIIMYNKTLKNSRA